MSVFRRTTTPPEPAATKPAPTPNDDLAPLGSAVDELLKPIQKRAPGNPMSRSWRRLVRRPKA
ncbi:hypothetical protein EV651_113209 [Kribbella sp. VKM Ac-2571]|uniref:hypothetical protein n=1 Tax=Kribbella sp. VKM Ac-2571 TaxID=2512222 RepID=UPI001061968D|nr:hypothetical protein [Kribbella sp. VKM Ac-2571]TDO56183.1 hypothetical protein EV651_113209 [Kribbella sp. VKM Ac-2571]